MNRYDMVIFDVDGTLFDTSEGIISSIRYVIKKMNYPELSLEDMRSFIGPPIQKTFAEKFNLDKEKAEMSTEVFRSHYADKDLYKSAPYAGIEDLLIQIKVQKIQTAVATYKREDMAIMLLKHFNLDKYMDIVHGSDYNGTLTKCDIIRKCISESGINDKSRIVMIGDTVGDASSAELAGIDFIGVTFGFGLNKNQDLAEIRTVGLADKAEEIINYIVEK